ncbi:MAG TPA: hypothetical protein PLA01_01850 [Acetivibrio sp.]|nr:hypothetical protein [Acetivibrio sp.]
MSDNNFYSNSTSTEQSDTPNNDIQPEQFGAQNDNAHSEQPQAANPFRRDWEPEAASNLGMGILGGLGAALIGAIIWAAITIFTGYQYSIAAVGMGLLVGGAVRLLGKGWEMQYRITGAVLSMLGCLLGNIFSIYAVIAGRLNISFFQVLATTSILQTIRYLQLTFSFYDILFYGVALVIGYKISAIDN